MDDALAPPVRSTNIPNVVPLSALRHRQAVQFSFTPAYDVDGPVPRRMRVVSSAPTQSSSLLQEAEPNNVRFERYPSENYEDDITPLELAYYRAYQGERLSKYDKMKKKTADSSNDEVKKKVPAPPPKKMAYPRGGRNAKQPPTAKDVEEEQKAQLERAIAAYLCIGTDEPVVDVPQLLNYLDEEESELDPQDMSMLQHDEPTQRPREESARQSSSAGEPCVPSSSAAANVTLSQPPRVGQQQGDAPMATHSRPSRRKLLRTKSQVQRPKLSLEENDTQRTVVDSRSGHPRTFRRLVYVPPPVEHCPPWLPVVATGNDITSTPSKGPSSFRRQASVSSAGPRRDAQPATVEAKSGRFSPNGGFYIPATMDDEFYSTFTCRPVHSAHDRGQRSAAQAEALEAQRATFDRLARPNVVSESSTTLEEGRILRYLASRRESSASPGVLPSGPIAKSPTAPSLGSSCMTPPNASFGAFRSPPPMTMDGHSGNDTPRIARVTFTGVTPSPSQQPSIKRAQPQQLDDEALLLYREQLPHSSRSNGCVGAAEIHYWMDMGHHGRTPHVKPDHEPCVAQVWMRRSLTEECHSARTVLRNYATRIPRDAVLAVTLRGVSFGQREADVTLTFAYGEAMGDEKLTGVANTIRMIVKEANNSDTARFRGPFLMCSASKSLCTYLRSYCLAMCSAEHPELAVLGFPSAHAEGGTC